MNATLSIFPQIVCFEVLSVDSGPFYPTIQSRHLSSGTPRCNSLRQRVLGEDERLYDSTTETADQLPPDSEHSNPHSPL